MRKCVRFLSILMLLILLALSLCACNKSFDNLNDLTVIEGRTRDVNFKAQMTNLKISPVAYNLNTSSFHSDKKNITDYILIASDYGDNIFDSNGSAILLSTANSRYSIDYIFNGYFSVEKDGQYQLFDAYKRSIVKKDMNQPFEYAGLRDPYVRSGEYIYDTLNDIAVTAGKTSLTASSLLSLKRIKGGYASVAKSNNRLEASYYKEDYSFVSSFPIAIDADDYNYALLYSGDVILQTYYKVTDSSGDYNYIKNGKKYKLTTTKFSKTGAKSNLSVNFLLTENFYTPRLEDSVIFSSFLMKNYIATIIPINTKSKTLENTASAVVDENLKILYRNDEIGLPVVYKLNDNAFINTDFSIIRSTFLNKASIFDKNGKLITRQNGTLIIGTENLYNMDARGYIGITHYTGKVITPADKYTIEDFYINKFLVKSEENDNVSLGILDGNLGSITDILKFSSAVEYAVLSNCIEVKLQSIGYYNLNGDKIGELAVSDRVIRRFNSNTTNSAYIVVQSASSKKAEIYRIS